MPGSTSELYVPRASAKEAAPETFTYTPLSAANTSFRLLRILPSLVYTSTIRCELFDNKIHDSEYIAGSYVWGPPEPMESIMLNNATFYVRQNLFHFLKACRSRVKSRVMWIDAVCINQEDNQEKSHQVRAMGRIYRNAQAVYCWLGLASTLELDSLTFPKSKKKVEVLREQLRVLAQSEYFGRTWVSRRNFVFNHALTPCS
jgi:hypothetical protein